MNQILNECRSLVDKCIIREVEIGVNIANKLYDYLEEKDIDKEMLNELLAFPEDKFNMILQGTYNLTISDIAHIETILKIKLI